MGSLLDNSLQLMSRCTKDSLFVRLWPLTDTPKGIVYIVHEIGGHCLLYEEIASKFNEAGFTVAANDHYGHGLSGGTRLHTSSYQTYIRDTVQCLQEVISHNPDTDNVILFGHGVGALLAALIAIQYKDTVKRLVLHAPVFKVREEQNNKLNMCWYLSYVLPYLYNPYKGVDPEDLIADESERRRYVNDPWIWHEGPRLGTIHAVLSAIEYLEQHSPSLTCPTLVQYGEKDRVINLESLREIEEMCETVSLTPYEGAKHFLHLDRIGTKLKVMEDMLEFCCATSQT